MNSTEVPLQPAVALPRVALGAAGAIVAALVVNTGIAYGTSALHPATNTGLIPVAYGPLTVLGVLAGIVGWAVVRGRATSPRALLRVLVPVVFVVSLVPGIVVLALGSSPVNVVGLWVMHLVVTIAIVTTAARVLPLRANVSR